MSGVDGHDFGSSERPSLGRVSRERKFGPCVDRIKTFLDSNLQEILEKRASEGHFDAPFVFPDFPECAQHTWMYPEVTQKYLNATYGDVCVRRGFFSDRKLTLWWM